MLRSFQHPINSLPEYFLEDCIQMTQFIPPPMEKKRKDKDEDGGVDEEVCDGFYKARLIETADFH